MAAADAIRALAVGRVQGLNLGAALEMQVLSAGAGEIRHIENRIFRVAVDDVVTEPGVQAIKISIECTLHCFLGFQTRHSKLQCLQFVAHGGV